MIVNVLERYKSIEIEDRARSELGMSRSQSAHYANANAPVLVRTQVEEAATSQAASGSIKRVLDAIAAVVDQNALEIRRALEIKEDRCLRLEAIRISLEKKLEVCGKQNEELQAELRHFRTHKVNWEDKIFAEMEKRRTLESEVNVIHNQSKTLIREKKGFDEELKREQDTVNEYVKRCQREIKKRFGYIPPSLQLHCLNKVPVFEHESFVNKIL